MFNSSDLKMLKNIAGFFAGYSAGFLIGKVIITVFENEKNIQRLNSQLYEKDLQKIFSRLNEEDIQRIHSRLKKYENECELKK